MIPFFYKLEAIMPHKRRAIVGRAKTIRIRRDTFQRLQEVAKIQDLPFPTPDDVIWELLNIWESHPERFSG